MSEAQKLLSKLFMEVQQSSMKRVADNAKNDPQAYKLTRVMPAGVRLSYRYWGKLKLRGGKTVTYCWSVNRNVAGYFLAWRETETANAVHRDQWSASKTKTVLKERQRRKTDAVKKRQAKG